MEGWETKRAVRLTRMAGIVRGASPGCESLAIELDDLPDASLEGKPGRSFPCIASHRVTALRIVREVQESGGEPLRRCRLGVPGNDHSVDSVAHGVAHAGTFQGDHGDATGQGLGQNQALRFGTGREREELARLEEAQGVISGFLTRDKEATPQVGALGALSHHLLQWASTDE